jgi:hypothetical protein
MALYGTEFVLTYTAWDTLTHSGVLGDAVNHTLRWVKDGTSSVPTNVPPSEVDSTNAPGLYKLTISETEAECVAGTLAGISSTENVNISPVQILFEHTNVNVSGWLGIPVTLSSTTLKPEVDIYSIGDDVTAASGLEYQYNGTGLTGDTYPATQAQVGNLTAGTAAINTTASAFVKNGAEPETNDYTDTVSENGTYHIVEGDGGSTSGYYEFDIGGNGIPISVTRIGYAQGNNDTYTLWAYNYNDDTYEQIGTLDGTVSTNVNTNTYDMTTAHVGVGSDLGKVRFSFISADGNAFATDRLLCSFTQSSRSVGYDDGAIWIDSAGIAGSEAYVNGVADNPCPWANAKVINSSLGLNRFKVANGNTLTLDSAVDNMTFEGDAWNLNLAHQSIDHAHFDGARIIGSGTSVNATEFHRCTFDTVGIPPSEISNCGIGTNGGVFTLVSSGQYIFSQCYSMVPGSDSPQFVANGVGEIGINNRGWTGGATWTLDASGTLSHEVLAGGGTMINTAGANVEIRGITRSLTLSLGEGGSNPDIQFVGIAGPVTITGTATATPTINLYGVSSSIANDSVNTSVNDYTTHPGSLYDVHTSGAIDNIGSSGVIAGAVWDEILTGSTHSISTSAGRRLRELAGNIIHADTARAGSTSNTIILSTDASSTDGAYDPSLISIVAGTGAGQSRLVLEYIGSSRVAIVDRNWKQNPDDSSEYVIYGHPGREHVNEGLAQGGTSNTITLNTLASSTNDAYKGQIVFIRSGTGEDQSALLESYNGSTKVATLANGDTWGVIPDTTSAYIMIPDHIRMVPEIASGVWDSSSRTLTANTNLNDPTAIEVADATLIRNISNVEDTAPEHSLGTLVMAGLNSAVSGENRYIYKSDQATVMYQQTVTVEPSGDPITGVS